MRTREKNGVVKEAIVLQWAVQIASRDFKPGKKAMGQCTARWKMQLFCAKTIVKESRKFELARLKKKKKKMKKKKKKKEKHLAVWWLSGSVLSRCFLAPLDVFFVMKTLEDERSGVITAYKLAVLEILRNLFVLA